MRITWYGTATIMIETEGKKLLFDPFYRMNKKLEQPESQVFATADYIFNTHPHFDHLVDMPKVLKDCKADVYGSYTMQEYLWRDGVATDRAVVLLPGDTLLINNALISAHKAKHIKNNVGIVLKTAARIIFKCQFARALKILNTHKRFYMRGDIVGYELKAEGRRVLIYGSAGIEKSDLPKDVDILIWPYQGRTGLEKYSVDIISLIKPKTLILDHFDDAFPPITGHINTDKFVKMMKEKLPDVEVIIPSYNKTIEI